MRAHEITARALKMLLLLLPLLLGTAACVEPDLGDAPVYCNRWEPRCPNGYTCVLQGKEEICAREGATLTHSGTYDDGGP